MPHDQNEKAVNSPVTQTGKKPVAAKPNKSMLEHLPTRFDFYNSGRVESVSKKCALADVGNCPFIVTFNLVGDEMGFCAIGFEKIPADDSLAIEVANILAAKFANQLAEATGAMAQISPPEVIEPLESRYRHVIASLQRAHAPDATLKSYEYIDDKGSRTTLRVAYLPAKEGRS